MMYVVKKSFKIVCLFALGHCGSRLWLNFAVIAGWQLRKHVIECLPSSQGQCGDSRIIINGITIFPPKRCPK
jgi:hypothetical protein